jgi:HEPN domain-containing protein
MRIHEPRTESVQRLVCVLNDEIKLADNLRDHLGQLQQTYVPTNASPSTTSKL